MKSDKNFTDHSYLINEKGITFVYKYLLLAIVLFIFLLLFTRLLFNSDNSIFYFFEFKISLYYLLPFIICLYSVLYSFYRILFVISKRFIKNIEIDRKLKITLISGKEILLEDFKIIEDQNKIKYINRDQLGGRVYKKYDYHYIGIKDKEMIYLLPYKKEFKDITIKLLESVSH